MRTRTLLLLAIGCGLAILLAGGVQLLRISGQTDTPPPLRVGASATVAGMEVTLVGTRSDPGADLVVVDLRIGGEDDDDVSDGFFLNAAGPVELPGTLGTRCGAVGETPTTCSLAFERPAEGQPAVLVYSRGRQRPARWSLR